MKQGFLAVVLASMVFGPVSLNNELQASARQQAVPDAPAPQAPAPSPAAQSGSDQQSSGQPNEPSAPTPKVDNSISDLASQAAHGKATPDDQQAPPPPDLPPASAGATADGPPQAEPPYIQKNPGEAEAFTIRQNVNFVEVPVTVMYKGQQVPGLTYRDFRVYENGTRQHIDLFSADAAPLSVAFVIDQSLPRDIMGRVNNALSAVTGAFTPQDEAAVFTYADGVNQQTTFTAATGDRLAAVLVRSKGKGTEMGTPDLEGPMAQGPMINNKPIDPNLTPGRSNTGMMTLPRETHTLNDAILAAGEALSKAKKGRRRIVYVISDGKEARSKAHLSEVVRYLQTNQESVYATLVGESAVPYIGYIDKFHLPLLPFDNILPRYTTATGGGLEAQLSTDGMERSFSDIMSKVRTQYTLGYYTHGSTLDSRYRKWNILVERPNLDVIAPPGYYPSASLSQR